MSSSFGPVPVPDPPSIATAALREHLLVVHREGLLGESLVRSLASEQRQVRGCSGRREEVLASLAAWPTDLVLIDAELPWPGAETVTRWICGRRPEARVLLYGQPPGGEESLLRAIEAGCAGFVAREASWEQLEAGLQALRRGEAVCPPSLTLAVFRRLAASSAPSPEACSHLSRRELEVLSLVAQQLQNKEIAVQLGISLFTVKNHVCNLLRKLEVADRRAAVHKARSEGWLAAGAGH